MNRARVRYPNHGTGTRSERMARVRKTERRYVPKAGFPVRGPLTREEIDAYRDESERTITCLLCGHEFRHLAKHIAYIHGGTTADYKRQFGIPLQWPLCCGEASRAMADHCVAGRERIHTIRPTRSPQPPRPCAGCGTVVAFKRSRILYCSNECFHRNPNASAKAPPVRPLVAYHASRRREADKVRT